MKWVRRLWPLLCAAYLGCSADGGPIGTGISSATSSISGNVIDVQSTSDISLAAYSATGTPVQVSIDDFPAEQTTTDGEGNFQLSGNFSGALTLRFTVPQFQVGQQVDVPSGSAIVLQDIELTPDGVRTQAARQLNFIGRVALVDCADGTLLVDDPRHMSMQFMVRLTEQTSIVRSRGETLVCDQLERGDTVAIEGAIQLQTDHTIIAVSVTLGPPMQHGGPPGVQDVSVSGNIVALDCDGRAVVIDDGKQRSRLRIDAMTTIALSNGTPLRCADLRLGDDVRSHGSIELKMPGTIDAMQIVVEEESPPGTHLRLFGFVTAIDCAGGVLQLADVSSPVDVHLLPTTVITGKNNRPAQCSDIGLGNRVTGTGEISVENPGSIDAITLSFARRDGPGGPPPRMDR